MANIKAKASLAKTKARVVKSKVKKAVKGLEPIQTTTFTTGESGKTAATAISWKLRKNMPDDSSPSGEGRRGVTNWDSRMQEKRYDPNSLDSQMYGVKKDTRRGRHAAPSSDSDSTRIDWRDWSLKPKNRNDHFDTGQSEGK